ncbi:MAG: hypothetical protein ACXAEF_02335 [Candidatus Thorarchaeota archaeon]|jgi:hypothetical protein
MSSEDDTGLSGMGRWLAVGTELPCSVIAMLLVGQILGQAILGPSGGTWGAILGAIFGFFLGVYGVFITINYYDRLEHVANVKQTYMPSKEEIHEDVTFDIPDEDE